MGKVVENLNSMFEKCKRKLVSKQMGDGVGESVRVEAIEKNLEEDEKMLDDETFRMHSTNIPLEYHLELLKEAYDIESYTIFKDLVKAAEVRVHKRRLEHQYVTDIDFLYSGHPNANVPNGYEKIDIDINEAYLRQELHKLRNKQKSKSQGNSKDEPANGKAPAKDAKAGDAKGGKDAGKGGKDAGKGGKGGIDTKDSVAPPSQLVTTATGLTALQSELDQIDHNYTYLIMKRSSKPDKAVYDVDVVIADEETGPVNYKKNGWKCVNIPINQYTGIRATYHTAPWLCFKQSKSQLRDENEKKSLLIDMQPIISKNPLIRPQFSYEKIPVDLRQVPKEFIKLSNIDYTFLSYKDDKFYNESERILSILNCLHN